MHNTQIKLFITLRTSVILALLSFMVACLWIVAVPHRTHALVGDLLQTTTSSLKRVLPPGNPRTTVQQTTPLPSSPRPAQATPSNVTVRTDSTGTAAQPTPVPVQEIIQGEPLPVYLQPIEFHRTANYPASKTSGRVTGASATSSMEGVSAIATSENEWQIWGITWYWWAGVGSLIVLSAIIFRRNGYQLIRQKVQVYRRRDAINGSDPLQ